MSTNPSTKVSVIWPGSTGQLSSGAGTAVTISPSSALSGGVLTLGGWKTRWEADMTIGQTVQAWSSGTTYAVVGSVGGNLNVKPKQGSPALTSIGMTSGGITFAYPDSPSSACGNVSFALADLGLSPIGGAAWRCWWRIAWSGAITSGYDNHQFLFDLDGTSATNSNAYYTYGALPVARGLQSGNAINSVVTDNIGTAVTGTNSAYATYDVFCVEQTCGALTVKLGTWSAGWPSEEALVPLNAGPIAVAQWNVGSGAPYPLASRLACRIGASGGSQSFTSRTVTIKNLRVQVL